MSPSVTTLYKCYSVLCMIYGIYFLYVSCQQVAKPVSTNHANISALQVDMCYCWDFSAFVNILLICFLDFNMI